MIDLLLKDQPPVIKAMLVAFIPPQAKAEIDFLLTSLATDLANDRDKEACDKVRALLVSIGINLDDYRN